MATNPHTIDADHRTAHEEKILAEYALDWTGSESRLLSLPGDATQAGPLDRPEPPKDWRDYSWDVSEEMTNLRQCYSDDPSEKRRLRLAARGRADVALQAIEEALDA